MRRDKEDERKNARNTLRYFELFFVKSDEVAAHGSCAAVGRVIRIGSKLKSRLNIAKNQFSIVAIRGTLAHGERIHVIPVSRPVKTVQRHFPRLLNGVNPPERALQNSAARALA